MSGLDSLSEQQYRTAARKHAADELKFLRQERRRHSDAILRYENIIRDQQGSPDLDRKKDTLSALEQSIANYERIVEEQHGTFTIDHTKKLSAEDSQKLSQIEYYKRGLEDLKKRKKALEETSNSPDDYRMEANRRLQINRQKLLEIDRQIATYEAPDPVARDKKSGGDRIGVVTPHVRILNPTPDPAIPPIETVIAPDITPTAPITVERAPDSQLIPAPPTPPLSPVIVSDITLPAPIINNPTVEAPVIRASDTSTTRKDVPRKDDVGYNKLHQWISQFGPITTGTKINNAHVRTKLDEIIGMQDGQSAFNKAHVFSKDGQAKLNDYLKGRGITPDGKFGVAALATASDQVNVRLAKAFDDTRTSHPDKLWVSKADKGELAEATAEALVRMKAIATGEDVRSLSIVTASGYREIKINQAIKQQIERLPNAGENLTDTHIKAYQELIGVPKTGTLGPKGIRCLIYGTSANEGGIQQNTAIAPRIR